MADRQQDSRAWHVLEIGEVESALDGTEDGLGETEAAARLKEFGPNALPHEPPPTLCRVILRQFQSPLIYILGVAAVVSYAIGDLKDALFIAAVLILNAAVGAYQEWRAEKSAQALQRLLKNRASVARGGEIREIDAETIVPGDVVLLESGNRVPADLRLLGAHGLEVDESLLTGESLPVRKDSHWIGDEKTVMADRLNLAHAGSIATRGRARGIVVATGTSTEVGRLALDVLGHGGGGKPPLLVRMERFSRAIAVGVVLMAIVIGALAFGLGHYEGTEVFLFTIALVVAVIPEGLPVAMTVALAIATTRMARRGVIVRRLTAVEGLGSCTFVATDKTGTLTCNELTVREIRLSDGGVCEVTGEGFAPEGEVLCGDGPVDVSSGNHAGLEALARAAVLCNEADLHQRDGSWVWRGDAVDIALLSMAWKSGVVRDAMLESLSRVNQIPFEPEHQFAASHHRVDGSAAGDRVRVFVKGAPERVLEMCVESAAAGAAHLAAAEEMAERGYRVLALAEGDVDAGLASPPGVPPRPSGLAFLGLVGMIDPLRAGARDAVNSCHDAGILISMVTGDHRITALAIARELGLATGEHEVMTGAELRELSDEELPAAIDRIRVFARVEPRQKLRIVRAIRMAGHFVAVTGDGANDAPALREANIGVAMGKGGTDVAREAAELVISDDEFSTIVAGIEEGRIAYENIRKVIYLLISTGAAELVLMMLAVASGLPLPLLPVQILWLNLVTQGIQDVALAFEPGEGDTLSHQPRSPKERIFNRLMIERTVVAAVVVGGVGFIGFHWMLANGWSIAEARNGVLLLLVLFENIHIGNCRSETKSAFSLSPLRSPLLLAGAVGAFLIHLAVMYLSFGRNILRTNPVPLEQWIIFLTLALTILPAMEIHKWTWNMRIRNQ